MTDNIGVAWRVSNLNSIGASCVHNYSLQVCGIGKGSKLRQPTQFYCLIHLRHLQRVGSMMGRQHLTEEIAHLFDESDQGDLPEWCSVLLEHFIRVQSTQDGGNPLAEEERVELLLEVLVKLLELSRHKLEHIVIDLDVCRNGGSPLIMSHLQHE